VVASTAVAVQASAPVERRLERSPLVGIVGRQRRLRIGDAWFRIDLLFFHRRLRCLVVIDLKEGEFTPSDAGQMNTYLNYAREHWTHADENPPVGLILASGKDEALAHYALGGLESSVLARQYKLALPEEKRLAADLAFLRQGITFNVYGDAQGTERIFPFDLVPRIIPAKEWEHIEAGLIQRITALNLFLHDIYHEQKILKDGTIPPFYVLSGKHFRREFVNFEVPKDIYIHICGTDLIRGADGRQGTPI